MLNLLTLLAYVACIAAGNVIGVAPENQHLYKPDSNGNWACLSDPSVVLKYDQINDGICDCPDGSDEPGTAACPSTKEKKQLFYCANEGFFPKYIESFKVNDGVCDYDICCDGSDEWATGKCPNKCAIVRQQFDEFVEKKRADIRRALQIREEYVKKVERAKADVGKKLERLQVEISDLEVQIGEENRKLKAAISSAEESDSGEQGALEEISQLSTQLENFISDFVASEKKSRSTIVQLESLLQDLSENYNPNYNDATVKQCVRLFREYISGKEEDNKPESSFSVELFKEKLKSLKPHLQSSSQNMVSIEPSIGNMVHHYYMKLISTFKPKEEQVAVRSTTQDNVSNKRTIAIEEKIKKLDKTLHSKKSEASIYEENLSRQFGTDDIFRAVEGEWVHRKIGEYNYKIGYLDSIYQDNTLVGRLTSVKGSTLHFEHGAKCWNGPHRSAFVDMVCAPKSRLVSVSEPEKCQYRFLLETPIVCEAKSDEQIADEFSVDPSDL
ncbi:hypothetical protein ACI3LY_003611 [Candidozyma auris]|uniref:Glucosidase 2 subunit beta n=1 Tax=Candidozyma auris TaxID=498019 RepID=A0A8F2W2F5_CANAR|nr:hypothetical protein QG37_00432 [[Candida] auris]QWW24251.1 hypothetical protein CA7LBN_003085 [[Candida] auris]